MRGGCRSRFPGWRGSCGGGGCGGNPSARPFALPGAACGVPTGVTLLAMSLGRSPHQPGEPPRLRRHHLPRGSGSAARSEPLALARQRPRARHAARALERDVGGGQEGGGQVLRPGSNPRRPPCPLGPGGSPPILGGTPCGPPRRARAVGASTPPRWGGVAETRRGLALTRRHGRSWGGTRRCRSPRRACARVSHHGAPSRERERVVGDSTYAMGGCGRVPARPGAGAAPRWILGGDSEMTLPQASVCPNNPPRHPPPRWGGVFRDWGRVPCVGLTRASAIVRAPSPRGAGGRGGEIRAPAVEPPGPVGLTWAPVLPCLVEDAPSTRGSYAKGAPRRATSGPRPGEGTAKVAGRPELPRTNAAAPHPLAHPLKARRRGLK